MAGNGAAFLILTFSRNALVLNTQGTVSPTHVPSAGRSPPEQNADGERLAGGARPEPQAQG